MSVRSYGPDTDFGFVLTLTLTITDMTLFMVMKYPRFMDNYCVKQNRESTEGYSKSIVRKNNDKFRKRICLNK